MMQLVRDEHNLVADMVKAQLAILGSDVDLKPIAAPSDANSSRCGESQKEYEA